MPTDQEVLDAIDSLSHSRRGVTEIAAKLGTNDIPTLDAQLLDLAKQGKVWMVAAWWVSAPPPTPNALTFEYTVRRGTVSADLDGSPS